MRIARSKEMKGALLAQDVEMRRAIFLTRATMVGRICTLAAPEDLS